MTEQEYINVRELSSVLDARAILRNVVAENSKVISVQEYRHIMELLGDWQDKLFKAIETKE